MWESEAREMTLGRSSRQTECSVVVMRRGGIGESAGATTHATGTSMEMRVMLQMGMGMLELLLGASADEP